MAVRSLATQIVVIVSLAAMLAAVGCGGPGGPPGTIIVTGVITIAGHPLPDGSIHFAPASGGGGAATRIANGRFRAYVLPGRYRIAVVSTEGPEQTDPETGLPVPGRSRVAERYLTAETSGLEAVFDESHRSLALAIEP